jgi:hypothetical protein
VPGERARTLPVRICAVQPERCEVELDGIVFASVSVPFAHHVYDRVCVEEEAMSCQAWRNTNLVLSGWLALSAFLWLHSAAQFHNAWTVAALGASVALVGAVVKPVRALNAALAGWLFFSAWAFPVLNDATFRNSVIVAIVMFLVSVVGLVGPTTERPAGPSMR